jgi:serine/threonine protein kinase
MLSIADTGAFAGSDDTPPRQIGPYRLCVELAAGGMGTVYLGRGCVGGSRHFAAVKVIHPHLANDTRFLQMFMDEAEIAARIRHPNVCRVLDFDVREERSYIAMEYLVGDTLQSLFRRLKKRQDDPRWLAARVARAVGDACEGLHAAHELTDSEGELLDVVHRDVTPGNIVLTIDGIAKVVDFGIAAAARKRHRTDTGVLKGKLAYVAPESLGGERPDRRVDVWGVGVIAWELLTGRRLFRRDNDLDTLRAITDGEIPRPSEVRAGLPEELDAVVLRALSRDPDERFSTARELGKALTAVATSEEVVTSTDLSEWLEVLMPGARERSEQLLSLAGQIASEGDGERASRPSRAPRVVETSESAAPLREPDEEWMPTGLRPPRIQTLRPPAPTQTEVGPAPAPRPRERWASFGAASFGAAAVVGLLLGVGASRALSPTEGEPEPNAPMSAPLPAPSDAAPTAPATELGSAQLSSAEVRVGAGMQIVRGNLVVELVPTSSDELVLRVRTLDRAPVSAEEPEPTPARARSVGTTPRRAQPRAPERATARREAQPHATTPGLGATVPP